MFLLGGAEATGQPNDTVVYNVAGDVQSQPDAAANRRGLGALAFMTLAPGYFWSDALFPPGGHVRSLCFTLYLAVLGALMPQQEALLLCLPGKHVVVIQSCTCACSTS